MSSNKTAIITGAGSGIGLATAHMLREKGYTVYNLSRHPAENEKNNFIFANVSDSATVKAAVEQVISASGRIDLLVTSAGMGVSGAVEFIDEEEMKRQFEVNLFGTINTVKAVLPQMRKQKEGKIICISSVAAVYSIPFQAYYSASKAAVNSFVDALTNEVKSFGIEVASVMPGDISTGFTAARSKTNAGDDVYSGVIGSAVSAMEKDEKNGMTPDSVAKLVVKLAEKKHVSPLYTAGLQYKTLVFLSRFFPHKLAVKIVGGMYK